MSLATDFETDPTILYFELTLYAIKDNPPDLYISNLYLWSQSQSYYRAHCLLLCYLMENQPSPVI